MSSNQPDETGNEELLLADRVTSWISDESNSVSTPEGPSKPCASCGDPHGRNWLVLTVEWEDHLSDKHGVDPPEEECKAPLCTRCRSWAEMLEIAEMNLSQHGDAERRQILEERDRFLDSLRIELVHNFNVSATLSHYE